MMRHGVCDDDSAEHPEQRRQRIGLAWLEYRAKMVHAGASPLEVIGIKLIFYTGAMSCFAAMLPLFEGGRGMTLADATLLQSMQDEFEQFCASAREGQA